MQLKIRIFTGKKLYQKEHISKKIQKEVSS